MRARILKGGEERGCGEIIHIDSHGVVIKDAEGFLIRETFDHYPMQAIQIIEEPQEEQEIQNYSIQRGKESEAQVMQILFDMGKAMTAVEIGQKAGKKKGQQSRWAARVLKRLEAQGQIIRIGDWYDLAVKAGE